MTKGELYALEQRISEIDAILEVCDDRFDLDIIDSLEAELDNIIMKLESKQQTKEIPCYMKLVK